MRQPWEELEPASRGAVERQRLATNRLDRFATTVFAASMALEMLMVLDRAAGAGRDGATASQVMQAVWPSLLAAMLGLLVLLSCWLVYHLEMHYLSHSSGTLLLIHVLLLPSSLFVPLSTTLLRTVGLTEHTALLLAGNALLLQALLLLTWRHAITGGLLFGSNVPARVVVRLRLMLRFAVLALLLTSGLSLVSAAVCLSALIAVLATEIVAIALGGYTLEPGPDAAHSRAG